MVNNNRVLCCFCFVFIQRSLRAGGRSIRKLTCYALDEQGSVRGGDMDHLHLEMSRISTSSPSVSVKDVVLGRGGYLSLTYNNLVSILKLPY
jgi:hypothetical protein